MQEFRLPDPGEGLTEAVVVSWKFKEGDQVKVNDIIVEIETAKSLVELPSPWTGTIGKILVAEGTEVAVGTPIVMIDDGSGSVASQSSQAASQTSVPTPASGSAGREFNLPDPGEGLTEAVVVSWKFKEGDQVKVNDIIVEIETAKSLVELPSPWTGTITKILVAEGTEVAVGTPIVMIDDGSAPAAPQPAVVADAGGANLVGYGTKEGGSARRARRGSKPAGAVAANQALNASMSGPNVSASAPALEQAVETAAPTGSAARSVVSGGKVLAKPPVRKYAKDHGIDLTTLPGSGPDGVITRSDVAAAIASGGPSGETSTASSVGESMPSAQSLVDRREPVKGVRKVTAQAMVDSAFTKVHVTEWVDVDVTATMEFIDQLKARREFREAKISPLLIFAKAVCLAMRRQPSINASWDDATNEIVYHAGINLGFAAATPRGLMVPNVKGAQAMSLIELNDAIQNLIKIARDGKLQPADYSGGTFTITNVGVFGMDSGTPIINGHESAILAMGSITRKPWVVGTGAEECIEPRWVTTLAMSFDHRLIDGEQGSKYLRDVADILANPSLALMY